MQEEMETRFGRFLMREVRDRSIRGVFSTLRGKAKAPFREQLYQRISSALSEEQLKLVEYLVPMIVDETLFELLDSIGSAEWVDVKVSDGSTEESLLGDPDSEILGDLFDWIRDYSQEPYDYLDDSDNV